MNFSLLERACEVFAENPASYSEELAELDITEEFLKKTCSDFSLAQAGDDMWPLSIRITMTIIFAGLSLIGIIGNILVVLVVFKVPGMRTPTNCYLVSLALSDCLFFLATAPTELSYLHSSSRSYVFGSIGCAIFTYAPYLAINTSSLSITAFTIERFIGICYPLRARYICTVKRAKLIIICIWIFSFIYNSPWLYLATLKEDNSEVSCSFKLERNNWSYKVIYFGDLGMFYVIPMILNILIYGRITYTLSKSTMKGNSPSIKPLPKEEPLDTHVTFAAPSTTAPREYFVNGGKRASTKGKMQVIKMLLIVVIIFAVCWFPYRTMIFINCAINPILYNVMSARFRNAFKKFFGSNKRSTLSKRSSMMQSTVLKEYRNGDTKILLASDDDPAVSNNS
ncbi:hypothetical protein FO519_006198 [Halicephalobus sp. NKZ332]|nr:hypothetical protein FO519_006198 [Halicephalobus sp. NKZ332]